MPCGNLFKGDEEGKMTGVYKIWGKPRLEFTLVKNQGGSEKAPDYIIQAKDPCGDVVSIGHAYENQIKKGERIGQKCFSVFFNEPGLFKAPVKCFALPFGNSGTIWDMDYDISEKPNNDDVSGGAAQAA